MKAAAALALVVLELDERGNHRPVEPLHHLGTGARILRQFPHLADHLLDARRRLHIGPARLEPRRLPHPPLPLRHQRDQLSVDPVDGRPNLIKRRGP